MKKVVFTLTLVVAICVCAVMTISGREKEKGKEKETRLPSKPSFSQATRSPNCWASTILT